MEASKYATDATFSPSSDTMPQHKRNASSKGSGPAPADLGSGDMLTSKYAAPFNWASDEGDTKENLPSPSSKTSKSPRKPSGATGLKERAPSLTSKTIDPNPSVRQTALSSQDIAERPETERKEKLVMKQISQDNPTPREPEAGKIQTLAAPKSSTPDILQRVSSPASATSTAPRKILSKRGKPCIIRIPREHPNDPAARKPLLSSAYEARVRSFIDNGYNTHGWDHKDSTKNGSVNVGQSQSQDMFPDPYEAHQEAALERIEGRHKIAIPNKKKWDDYMNRLTEEKLKALGVLTGEEEQKKEVDMATSLPQQTQSPFSGMPMASPPIPSSSVASQNQWQNTMPFSAPFSPGNLTNNTSTGALGSPNASAVPPQFPGHFSRQSTLAYPFPSASNNQNLPSSFAPQPGVVLQNPARSASPAFSTIPQRIPSVLARASPDLSGDRSQTPRGSENSQKNSRRGTLLSEVSLAQDADQKPIKDDQQRDPLQANGTLAEMAYPTPRGHRHNISRNLEREVENAEFYPGEYVDGTPERSEGSSAKVRKAGEVENSRGQQTLTDRDRGHRAGRSSVSSASRFNVEAKEFKFDPGKAHARTSSAAKNPFMPSAAAVPASSKPTVSLVTAHANGAATGGEDFKKSSRPSFKPPAQGDFSFSSGFDFAARGPAEDVKSEAAPQPDKEPGQSQGARIFNFADIIKPAKENKAIPIVKPETNPKTNEDDDLEDESGRITQSKGRFKRGRHEAPNGEDLPQFGAPGHNAEAENLQRAMAESSLMPTAPVSISEAAKEPDYEAAEAQDYWQGVSDEDASQHTKTPEQVSKHESRERSPAPSIKNLDKAQELLRDQPRGRGGKKPSIVSPKPPRLEKPGSDQFGKPTFHEIDNIMQQLNKSDPDVGIESAKDMEAYIDEPSDDLQESKFATLANEVPAPDNRRGYDDLGPPIKSETRPSKSPVRQLNNHEHAHVSDWDDMIASDEDFEGKFQPPSQFFDARVKNMIESVVQQQFGPLQKSLKDVDATLKLMSAKSHEQERSKSSATQENSSSDADDEDNADDARSQPKSREIKSDRKLDRIRSVVQDAVSAATARDEALYNPLDIESIRHVFLDAMSSKMNNPPPPIEPDLIRSIVNDALSAGSSKAEETGPKLNPDILRAIVKETVDSAGQKEITTPVDKLDADTIRAAVLEAMVSAPKNLDESRQLDADSIRAVIKEAIASSKSDDSTERLEAEMTLRNEAERRAEENQHMLTMCEKEIALFKEAGEAIDEEKQKMREERHMSQKRVSDLERIERELRTKISGLSAEIGALESTLEEYRTSADKWRHEIENAKFTRESLQATIERFKKEAEESGQIREDLTSRLDKTQDSLENVSNNLATERRVWQRKDEELGKETAILSTRLEEEFRRRQRAQEDLEQMRVCERNAVKATVTLEETRNMNARLNAEVAKLREENANQQTDAALHEREAIEAKDIARAEIQRNKTLLEAEIDINNRKAESVRVDLETRLEMTEGELMRARLGANAANEDFKRKMDEAQASRSAALRGAADAANATLNEERKRLEHLMDDLSKQHDASLRSAHDERQRVESNLHSSLELSNSKIMHLEDVIKHLQDKVTVAQSAAQAAAQAASSQQQHAAKEAVAQSKRAAERPPAPSEKISPQALRESVVVLQEQLQERQTRIERLESDNARFTKDDDPHKLRERDTETGWLRELLGVRIDDISELVQLLSRDDYDRTSARNAAIRLRANLQMAQQERERGVGSMMRLPVPGSNAAAQLPSLSDIQNFASPQAAKLAAAWGNWRRGGQLSVSSVANHAAGENRQTPSKRPAAADAVSSSANAAQNFLSGLMTPPASNLRRTPSTHGTQQRQMGMAEMPHRSSRQGDTDGASDAGSITAPSDAEDAQPLPLSLQMPPEDDDDADGDLDEDEINRNFGVMMGPDAGDAAAMDEGVIMEEAEKTPTRPTSKSGGGRSLHARGRSRQKNVPERETVGVLSPLGGEERESMPMLDGTGNAEQPEKMSGEEKGKAREVVEDEKGPQPPAKDGIAA